MYFIRNVFQWIWYSSADPSRVSLTVKSIGLGLIPTELQLLNLTCGFHLLCVDVNADGLNSVVLTVSNIVYWSLSIISGIAFLYGFFRKILLSLWK